MARIPRHIVDEIMSTARIEEVVGEYVHLKKAGSNYKGLSPFSEEKTPSFVVSPAKQIYKDFSSGKGGTVVTFLMEIEQFSYPEALKWLAERYNIILPEEKPLTPEEIQELSERESLQIVNDFARDFFVETIKTSKEGKAIGYAYFIERGFRPETIEKFQLGYSPLEGKNLTETALEKGYKQNFLEQLGLTKTHGERRFDFFSGRAIFPIHSVSGKVLGFGGRTLQESKKTAKYFNSPESVLYDKSKILYGMYFAKQEIVKQDNCFLVEGYTDVISLFQAGVENVVSSSGTSLTKGQIKLIQRYTSNVTVLYDSDSAGIKASFRGIDLLLEEGMVVKTLLLPEGEDPDSFARRVSSDELKTYFEKNQQDFVGFKSQVLLEGVADNPIEKSKLIRDIVGSIALIPDEIARSVYIQQTATRFDFKEETLLNEMNKIRRVNQRERHGVSQPIVETNLLAKKETKVVAGEGKRRDFYEQEKDLIRILIQYGNCAVEIIKKEEETGEENKEELHEISVAELIVEEMVKDNLSFHNPMFQEMYEDYKEVLEADEFYPREKFLYRENQDIVRFVSDILSPEHELSDSWFSKYKIETAGEMHKLGQAVKEALYSFKSSVVMRKIEKVQNALKNNMDLAEEDVLILLSEQMTLEKIKREFAKGLNRIII